MLRLILCLHLLIFIASTSGATEGDVRLVEGSYYSGILEVFHNGFWGGVCDDNFDHNDAQVICYQLGFFRSRIYYSVSRANNYFFWLSYLACSGTEKSITSCSSNAWGVHHCNNNEHIKLTCEIEPCDFVSNGDCFIVSNTYLSWSEAEANCVTHGGHLANIQSATENSNFRNSFSSYAMWIGLYYNGSDYQWVDNSTNVYRSRYYSTYYTGNSYCVSTYYSSSYGSGLYYWRTYNCNAQIRSVCRVPGAKRVACGKCDLHLNGNCLFYVPALMTWNDADSACKTWGGNLLSIHSSSERFTISNTFNYNTGYRNFGFYYTNSWLGLNDIATERTWLWSDGTPYDYQALYYNHYYYYSGYDCAYVYRYYYYYTWYGTYCTNLYPFICSVPEPTIDFQVAEETENYVTLIWEVPVSIDNIDHYALMLYDERAHMTELSIPGCVTSYNLTHPDTDYAYTVAMARCSVTCCSDYQEITTIKKPNDGIEECRINDCDFELNGDCFKFESLELSWAVAEERCNNWAGQLASIRSLREQLAIVSNAPSNFSTSNVWIGLNDTRQEGTYTWNDGSPNTYANWLSSTPNQNIFQDCVAISFPTGYWDDLSCTETHYSICRKPIPEIVNGVISFSATQIGADFATLNWIPATNQHVAKYILKVRALGRSNRHLIYLSSCTDSYNVTLSSGTTYSVALYTCANTCCDNLNTNISLTTGNNGSLPVLSIAPQNLTAEAVDSSSIMVTWSKPCNIRLFEITSYSLSYSRFNSPASVIVITSNSSLNYSTVITDLEAYTAYSIKIVAVNSAGESPPASIDYVRTLEAEPGIASCIEPNCDLQSDGNCYIYVGTTMTWSDAENNCIAWGGHLTSITSAVEDARVGSITTSLYDTWIGLNDLANERNYVWVSGETSSYRNWYNQAHFSFNDCVAIKTGSGSYQWDDLNCASKYASVCSQALPVSIDAPVSLASSSIGSNRITVTWDSTPLLNLRYFIVAVKAPLLNTSYTSLSSCISSYTIQQLAKSTAYTISLYACSITCCNNTGAVFTATTAEKDSAVQDVSNPPESLIATAMNESAIRLEWDIPCNDLILTIDSYKVTYTAIASGSAWTSTIQATTAYSNYSTVITGLEAYTAYSIKVVAVNSAGESPAASIDYVRTLEAAPSETVRNLSAVLIDLNSAVISWLAPLPGYQNGKITGYQATLMAGNSTVTAQNVSNQYIKLSSLTPLTEYTLYVAASTAAGDGPVAAYTFMTSTEAQYMNEPQYLTATHVNSTSLQVNWTAPPHDINGGVIDNFIIKYRKMETDAIEKLISEPFTDTQANYSTVITGLEAYTAYSIKVVAVNSAGESPAASIDYVRTLEAAPSSEVRNLTLIILSRTNAAISWLPPLPGYQNGIITGYQATLIAGNSTVTAQTISNQYIKLSSLTPVTEYTLYVVASTAAGDGPVATYTFMTSTEAEYMAGAENMTATPINSTSIEVFWISPPYDVNGGSIDSFTVIYSKLVETGSTPPRIMFVWASTTAYSNYSTVITDLEAYTAYSIKVVAVNSAGESPAASIEYIRTLEAAPSSEVRNITLTLVSNTNAVISWLPPLPGYQNGVITGYLATLIAGNSTVTTQNVSNQYIKLSSLTPVTEYTLYVAASTAAGDGPVATYTFMTSTIQVPFMAGAENMTATPVSATSIEVSWNSPLYAINGGSIDSYTVIYSNLLESNSNSSGILNVSAIDTQTNYSTVITGLEAYTAYSIKVVAVNSAGESPAASIDYVRTLEAAPSGAPQQISLIDKSNHSVIVWWAQPNSTLLNGIVTHYKFLLINEDTSEILAVYSDIAPMNNVKKLFNLVQNRNYRVSIAAATKEGYGPYGNYSFVTFQDPESSFMNTEVTVTPKDYENGVLTLSIDWSVEQITEPDASYDVSVMISSIVIREFTVPFPPTYAIINLYHYIHAASNLSTYNLLISVCESTTSLCARELEFVWNTETSLVNPPSTVDSQTSGSISGTQFGVIVAFVIIAILAIVACLVVIIVVIVFKRRRGSPKQKDQLYAHTRPTHTGAYAQNDISKMTRPAYYNESAYQTNPMFNEYIDETLKKKSNPPDKNFEISLSIQNVCRDKITEPDRQDRPSSIFKNVNADTVNDDNVSAASV